MRGDPADLFRLKIEMFQSLNLLYDEIYLLLLSMPDDNS